MVVDLEGGDIAAKGGSPGVPPGRAQTGSNVRGWVKRRAAAGPPRSASRIEANTRSSLTPSPRRSRRRRRSNAVSATWIAAANPVLRPITSCSASTGRPHIDEAAFRSAATTRPLRRSSTRSRLHTIKAEPLLQRSWHTRRATGTVSSQDNKGLHNPSRRHSALGRKKTFKTFEAKAASMRTWSGTLSRQVRRLKGKKWYPERDSNSQGQRPVDFESTASTNSAIRAWMRPAT